MTPEQKVRLDGLNQVIHEGDIIQSFLEGQAWTVIEKTLRAKSDEYKHEAFEAARDDRKDIRNFLGRQEAVEWVIQLLDSSFVHTRDNAMIEKISIMDEIKEQQAIDSGVHDHVASQSYPGEKPGLI